MSSLEAVSILCELVADDELPDFERRFVVDRRSAGIVCSSFADLLVLILSLLPLPTAGSKCSSIGVGGLFFFNESIVLESAAEENCCFLRIVSFELLSFYSI